MRLRVFVATVAAGLCAAAIAHADDATLALTWTAPPGCPSRDAVHAAAIRGAGRDAKASPLEADARIEHKDTWRVTLRTRRGSIAGERDLEATTCQALADATAVILGLALVEPGTAPAAATSVETKSAEPSTTPAPASHTPEKPADPDRPAPVAPRASDHISRPAFGGSATSGDKSHVLAASASVSGDAATLPSLAAGGAIALAWTPGRARLEIAGAKFASQSRTTGISPAGAELSLATIGARGCWSLTRNPIDLAPCAGLDVQIVRARGFGATGANYDQGAQWLGATGGMLVRVPISGFLALRAQLDAVVPLSRPTFVVEGEGNVHRPPSLGARGAIGAEIDFL